MWFSESVCLSVCGKVYLCVCFSVFNIPGCSFLGNTGCSLWGDHWGLLVSMLSTPKHTPWSLAPLISPWVFSLLPSPPAHPSFLQSVMKVSSDNSLPYLGSFSIPYRSFWSDRPIRWLVGLVSQPILWLPCPFKDCPSLTLDVDVNLSAFPAPSCLQWLHFTAF